MFRCSTAIDPAGPSDLPPINEGLRQLDKDADGEEIVVNWVFAVSYLLTLLALIAVFVYIPFVSQWAFWVLISSYLLLASHRQYIIWVAFR